MWQVFKTKYYYTVFKYHLNTGSPEGISVIFTAQCTLVHMRGIGIACRPSVRPSVTLVICDHIGWKSWKLIARTISATPSLYVAERRSTYSQGNMEKFRGD